MNNIIPFNLELRQAIPEINGTKEYKKFRDQLIRMDKLIDMLGLEDIMMYHELKIAELKRVHACKRKLSDKEKISIEKLSIKKLRCVISRNLTQESYECFSIHLADSILFQSFCKLNIFGKIDIPSKSSLQRYEKDIPVEIIKKLTDNTIITDEKIKKRINLKVKISTKKIYIDTTCLETNIHFPVDWLLLRDATMTLMKSIRLIREAGLKNRMAEPKKFMQEINKLSISMTNTRRKRGGKKIRKAVFRKMKKLLKKIQFHAEIHCELLYNNWTKTSLTLNEVKQILKRIENVLEKLPQAIHQAHERIIGERIVVSEKKLLSLYESDTNVIVRGKSSAEVEFGNKLLLGELENGLIMNWNIYKKGSPSDSKVLPAALEEIKITHGTINTPKTVITDRGFVGPTNENYLLQNKILNYICPRSIIKLKEMLKDPAFCKSQTRRSQTEGRIGIIKNNFAKNAIRSKGFASREQTLAWSILTHNLWLLSRLPYSEEILKKSA
jgi:hypothetical protein